MGYVKKYIFSTYLLTSSCFKQIVGKWHVGMFWLISILVVNYRHGPLCYLTQVSHWQQAYIGVNGGAQQQGKTKQKSLCVCELNMLKKKHWVLLSEMNPKTTERGKRLTEINKINQWISSREIGFMQENQFFLSCVEITRWNILWALSVSQVESVTDHRSTLMSMEDLCCKERASARTPLW